MDNIFGDELTAEAFEGLSQMLSGYNENGLKRIAKEMSISTLSAKKIAERKYDTVPTCDMHMAARFLEQAIKHAVQSEPDAAA